MHLFHVNPSTNNTSDSARSVKGIWWHKCSRYRSLQQRTYQQILIH